MRSSTHTCDPLDRTICTPTDSPSPDPNTVRNRREAGLKHYEYRENATIRLNDGETCVVMWGDTIQQVANSGRNGYYIILRGADTHHPTTLGFVDATRSRLV